jgi:signal transduction histidine kinase
VHAAIDRACETDAGPEGLELLRRTRDELRQLADLVDPLLQWSMGTGTITRQPTDLVPVVREGVTSSSLGWDGRRVEIDAVDRLVVLGDARQLRGAISNIIRNSMAYSPADEPIKVLVERAGRFARVEVRDRGPGVPADERQLVFDPFERGRLGQSTRAGSGLGLFVARRVLEAHGGTISLRPTRSGAAFRLELPILEERSQRFAS